MPKPIRVAAVAAREMGDAKAWLDAQVPGLGDRFVHAVDRVLAEIAEQPSRYALIHGDIRRAVARPVPHGVFFRDLPNAVRVIAIVHLRRSPMTWQRRH